MIGLIPAAGHATRIHGLPKFLLPVPGSYLLKSLFTRMEMVRPKYIAIGTNSQHFDLVCRYNPAASSAYGPVYCVDSVTMSETVLAARSYIDVDETVVFGMPDTYWTDYHVYEHSAALLHADNQAIASAALWQVDPAETYKHGMCEVTADGGSLRVTQVLDKPTMTTLRLTWGALAWQPAFWRYIDKADPHVGFALDRAIAAGEVVRGKTFDGAYFNIGTEDDYFACIRALTDEAVTA